MCWSGAIGLSEYDRSEKLIYDRYGEALTEIDPYSFIQEVRSQGIEEFAEMEAKILKICGHYQKVACEMGLNRPRMILRILLFKDNGEMSSGMIIDVADWEDFCPNEQAAVEYFNKVKEGLAI